MIYKKLLYIIIPVFYLIIFFILKFYQGFSQSDADTWMHLNLIEQTINDFLHGDATHRYNFYDFTDCIMRRDNANGGGTELIWTLPYNMFIILCSSVFWIFGYNIHQSLDLTSYVIGPIIMMLNIFIFTKILSLIWNKKTLLNSFPIIVFLSVFNIILLSYSLPSRVSHHPLTLSFCMLSLYYILKWGKSLNFKDSILAGIFLTTSCWSSMETLPFCMIIIYVIWNICLYRGYNIKGIWAYKLKYGLLYMFISILFLGTLILFIDHPLQGFWHSRFDRYSIFQLFTLLLGVFIGIISRENIVRYNLSTLSPYKKFIYSILLSVIFLILWMIFVVFFIKSSINVSDYYVYQYFWKVDTENLSILQEYNDVSFYLPVVPIFIITFFIMIKAKNKIFWSQCFFILAGLIFIGLCSLRLMIYADMLSILIAIMWIYNKIKSYTNVFVILLGALSLFYILFINVAKIQYKDSCSINEKEGKIISNFIGDNYNVMTDIWIAPNIIWNTNLNTVAGPYHPNISGIHDTGIFWIGDMNNKNVQNEIQNIIKKRNIKGIISCNKNIYLNENYYSKNTMKQLLHNNSHFSWIDYKYIRLKDLYIYKTK